MSYHYDSLENALELAAHKLPVKILGNLIGQVEDIITVRGDCTALEKKIYAMIENYAGMKSSSVFAVDRIASKEATHTDSQAA